MIQIGKTNQLRIDRIVAPSPGAFLVDEEENEVLLPTKYIPINKSVEDLIDVFIYTDSEDRLIATTLTPHVKLHEFGCLKVKDVNQVGAFLDWGLEKDILVPFRQQNKRMQVGQWALIYLYLDELTNRLAASAKVQKYYEKEEIALEVGQEVDLLIAETTELGINVVVDNKYRGLIFENQIFHDLIMGERIKGYVQNIRSDNKIDISLRKTGIENLEEGAQKILNELNESSGYLALWDKSTPDEIQSVLQMSKKNFKKSVGILYRKKLIKLVDDGIRLI